MIHLTDEEYAQISARAENLGTLRGEADADAGYPSLTAADVRYIRTNESLPASVWVNISGPLAGEWAGDPEPSEVLEEAGLYDSTDNEVEDEILRAYEDAWSEAFETSLINLAIEDELED